VKRTLVWMIVVIAAWLLPTSALAQQSVTITNGPQPVSVGLDSVGEYDVSGSMNGHLVRATRHSSGKTKIDKDGYYLEWWPQGVNPKSANIAQFKKLSKLWPETDFEQVIYAHQVKEIYTITGAGAPTQFEWTLNTSAVPVLQPDGSIVLGDSTYWMPAPWAIDANGDSVDVTVSLAGPSAGLYTLIYDVAHAGTAYPVLIDPTVEVLLAGNQNGRIDGGDMSADWLTARADNPGENRLEGQPYIGTEYIHSQTRFRVYRSLYSFSLATLPEGVTLDSARFRMEGVSNQTIDAEFLWSNYAVNTDTLTTAMFTDFPGWESGSSAYSGVIALTDTINTTGLTTALTYFHLNSAGMDSLQAVYDDGRRFSVISLSSRDIDATPVPSIGAANWKSYVTTAGSGSQNFKFEVFFTYPVGIHHIAVDGSFQAGLTETRETTWAVARNVTTPDYVYEYAVQTGVRYMSTNKYSVWRGQVHAPTTTFPSGAAVDSIFITLYDGNDATNSFDIDWGPYAMHSDTLANGTQNDFAGWASSGSYVPDTVKFADEVNSADFATTQEFKLNQTAIDSFTAAAARGGPFNVIFLSRDDITNNAPITSPDQYANLYYDGSSGDYPPQVLVYYHLTLVTQSFNATMTALSDSSYQVSFQDSSRGRAGYFYAQPDGQILDWRTGNDSLLVSGIPGSTFTFVDTITLVEYTPDFLDSLVVCVFDSVSPSPNIEMSLLLMACTSARIPTIPGIVSMSDSSVSIQFSDTSGNPGTVAYALYDSGLTSWRDTSGVTGSLCWAADSCWNGLALSGYSINEQVHLGIIACNRDSLLTGDVGATVYTWAMPPDTTYTTLIDSASVRLRLSPNGNPAYTHFAVEDSVSGLFVDLGTQQLRSANITEDSTWAFGTYADWGGDVGLVLNVQPNQTYYLRAYAKDGNP
jgi:hypothetical protein